MARTQTSNASLEHCNQGSHRGQTFKGALKVGASGRDDVPVVNVSGWRRNRRCDPHWDGA